MYSLNVLTLQMTFLYRIFKILVKLQIKDVDKVICFLFKLHLKIRRNAKRGTILTNFTEERVMQL